MRKRQKHFYPLLILQQRGKSCPRWLISAVNIRIGSRIFFVKEMKVYIEEIGEIKFILFNTRWCRKMLKVYLCWFLCVCVFFFLFTLGFMSGRNVVSYLTASPSVEYFTSDAEKICTLTIFIVQNVRFYACKPTLYFLDPHS